MLFEMSGGGGGGDSDRGSKHAFFVKWLYNITGVWSRLAPSVTAESETEPPSCRANLPWTGVLIPCWPAVCNWDVLCCNSHMQWDCFPIRLPYPSWRDWSFGHLKSLSWADDVAQGHACLASVGPWVPPPELRGKRSHNGYYVHRTIILPHFIFYIIVFKELTSQIPHS